MKYFTIPLLIWAVVLGLLPQIWTSEIRAEERQVFLLTVPQSGPLEHIGLNALQGAELALKIWGGSFTLEVVDEADADSSPPSLEQVAVALGYFSESRLMEDTPTYLYAQKPVLLPFLTTSGSASRGPGIFFRLMPTYQEQGRFLAEQILKLRKRPKKLLIIKGQNKNLIELVTTLTATLAKPPKPDAASGKKPLKPLGSKAKVEVIGIEQLLTPDGLIELKGNRPDLIILAVELKQALTLAPLLAASKLAKTPYWSGSYLGFRDVGAAFVTLGLPFSLGLPPVNLTDKKSRDIREFNRRYVAAYHAHPTWISALAYDAMNMAIKATSAAATDGDILGKFINEYHALGTYKLTPGGGDNPPMAMMKVTENTLGFLP